MPVLERVQLRLAVDAEPFGDAIELPGEAGVALEDRAVDHEAAPDIAVLGEQHGRETSAVVRGGGIDARGDEVHVIADLRVDAEPIAHSPGHVHADQSIDIAVFDDTVTCHSGDAEGDAADQFVGR
ncbi:MAG: hypothetical protein KDB28_07035, partial [Tetrasphaera sp.]|nr:hypothetical protein [Tetrasphaera sp.]